MSSRPPEDVPANRAAAFEAERRRLTGLAYRLLGSMSDAEDVMQDAWLRWQNTPLGEIRQPSAFLSTITTRLCLDRLKQARRHREVYVGPWLPEPVLEDPASALLPEETIASDVSFALMLALERLSPLERAAFVLHDVFDMNFAEIATTLGRSEAACRQLAKRAREHIRAERPRFTVNKRESEAVAEAFFAASRTGDAQILGRLLAETATLQTDGGGRATAALNIIHSAAKVARFFIGIARKPRTAPPRWSRRITVNGLPAELTLEADGTRQLKAVEISAGQISNVYIIRNPEKLERLWAAVAEDAPVTAAI
ncbi:sigma-70 family RNA polymerase sigma factor [Pedomonas mirosovicensis]|uniref:sigma-70 family RNA polymerase sigma factor n=1 Tax=Pedomonas mirosovicensis TaxID=2908641 RepID=UPI002167EE06|nr:sigma-70 family RNA polymerase sigma factor [Pedomonas mirosovicensis]MCH8684338.1 sigma-70 family RNA polymerase sigma factor [Pedomonas mirosovicensis]